MFFTASHSDRIFLSANHSEYLLVVTKLDNMFVSANHSGQCSLVLITLDITFVSANHPDRMLVSANHWTEYSLLFTSGQNLR